MDTKIVIALVETIIIQPIHMTAIFQTSSVLKSAVVFVVAFPNFCQQIIKADLKILLVLNKSFLTLPIAITNYRSQINISTYFLTHPVSIDNGLTVPQ